MMNKVVATSAVLLLVCSSAFAETVTVKPLTWSSAFFGPGPTSGFNSGCGTYDPVTNTCTEEFDNIGTLTLTGRITIVRLQFQAKNAPNETVNGAPQSPPCPTPPTVVVTNGTTATNGTISATLTINSGFQGPTASDSGPLSVSFPAGTTIRAFYGYGDPYNSSTNSGCADGPGNLTVQYRVPSN